MKLDTFLIFMVAIIFGCTGNGESASKDPVSSPTVESHAVESHTVVAEEITYKQTQTDDTEDSTSFESSHDSIQGNQSERDPNEVNADTQDPDAGSANGGSAGIASGTTGSSGRRNDDAQTPIEDAFIDELDASILEDSGETVEETDSGETVEEADSGSDAIIQKPDVVCDSEEPKVRCGPFRICEGLTPYCFITFSNYSTISGSYCGSEPLFSSSTTVPFYCDDSCDCPQGQICCGGSSKGAAHLLQSGRCTDACSFIYDYQLCRVDEECPGQKICSNAGSNLPWNPPPYFTRCVDP